MPDEPYTGTKRVDGPTPNGGTYALQIWVDGKVVEVQECAADGTVLLRAYADTE